MPSTAGTTHRSGKGCGRSRMRGRAVGDLSRTHGSGESLRSTTHTKPAARGDPAGLQRVPFDGGAIQEGRPRSWPDRGEGEVSRRANGEGSRPVQRKDGRWQVGIRYSVDGVGKRTTRDRQERQGGPRQGPGGPGPAPGGSAREGPQGDARRVHRVVDRLDPRGLRAEGDDEVHVRDSGPEAHHRRDDRAGSRRQAQGRRRSRRGRSSCRRAGCPSQPSARPTRSCGRFWILQSGTTRSARTRPRLSRGRR